MNTFRVSVTNDKDERKTYTIHAPDADAAKRAACIEHKQLFGHKGIKVFRTMRQGDSLVIG